MRKKIYEAYSKGFLGELLDGHATGDKFVKEASEESRKTLDLLSEKMRSLVQIYTEVCDLLGYPKVETTKVTANTLVNPFMVPLLTLGSPEESNAVSEFYTEYSRKMMEEELEKQSAEADAAQAAQEGGE